MKGLKNRAINLIKRFNALNGEAKLGVLFLIPPIVGVVFFVLNILGADVNFYSILESWYCINDYENNLSTSTSLVYSPTLAIPIYLGLMAIVGAYLVKGNLNKGN